MPSGEILILLAAVVIVGALIFIAISLTKKRPAAFDQEQYQTDFLKIENTLSRDNELSWNAVVTEADKLLDKALGEAGVPGKTMGDRLKASSTKFNQINAVWYAHKLRNQIAHEHHFQLSYNQAANALRTYREALQDLGAI